MAFSNSIGELLHGEKLTGGNLLKKSGRTNHALLPVSRATSQQVTSAQSPKRSLQGSVTSIRKNWGSSWVPVAAAALAAADGVSAANASGEHSCSHAMSVQTESVVVVVVVVVVVDSGRLLVGSNDDDGLV